MYVWFVFGLVSEAGDGAAGIASVRNFVIISPDWPRLSQSAPLWINVFESGNWFANSLFFWEDIGQGERERDSRMVTQ